MHNFLHFEVKAHKKNLSLQFIFYDPWEINFTVS